MNKRIIYMSFPKQGILAQAVEKQTTHMLGV
jgi:hypothetical protein